MHQEVWYLRILNIFPRVYCHFDLRELQNFSLKPFRLNIKMKRSEHEIGILGLQGLFLWS